MSVPQTLTKPEVTGRLGLAENEHGTTVTLFICSECGSLFSVTGDINPSSWGTGCLAFNCASYDVERDADLMFEVEPWKIKRKEP